jgi:hypothetical protein
LDINILRKRSAAKPIDELGLPVVSTYFLQPDHSAEIPYFAFRFNNPIKNKTQESLSHSKIEVKQNHVKVRDATMKKKLI